MITINTEKELVKIENMEDIYTRPKFRKDLNPKLMALKTIIGKYELPNEINCGLSNCHTPHKYGYLVTTPEGIETNIGQTCGFRHFGVKFKELSARLKRDITEKENREKIKEFQHQIPNVESRLHHLQFGNSRSANWCHRMISYLMTSSKLPTVINRKINLMRRLKTNILTVEREVTVEEKEVMLASGSQIPATITETVSEIIGFSALYEENNLKNLLIDDLAQNTKHIKSQDIESLDFKELQRWAKWVGTVEQSFQKVEQIVSDAQKLLIPHNLKPLRTLLTKREEKQQFNCFIELLSQTSTGKAA